MRQSLAISDSYILTLVCEDTVKHSCCIVVSCAMDIDTGTNWKDIEKGITYKRYLKISDKEHIKKIINMPVYFLQESGKGFFIKEEGSALSLRKELEGVIKNRAFIKHMGDTIEYRAVDYYQKRYRANAKS